jgi:hypothetical protein
MGILDLKALEGSVVKLVKMEHGVKLVLVDKRVHKVPLALAEHKV